MVITVQIKMERDTDRKKWQKIDKEGGIELP